MNRVHGRSRGAHLPEEALPAVGSARVGWRILAQVLITLLALALVLRGVPWHDRAHLTNGTPVVILERPHGLVKVEVEAQFPAAPVLVLPDAVRQIEPGVRSLLVDARPQWLLFWLGLAISIGGLLIIRWYCLLWWCGASPTFSWCATAWARSQVINALPLSQIGGDLYRLERGRRLLRSGAASVGIIAVERIAGLAGLVGMASIGLAASGMKSTQLQTWLLLSAVVCLLVLPIAWARRRHEPRTTAALERGASRSRDRLAERGGLPLFRSARGWAGLVRKCRGFLQRSLGPLRELAWHPRRLLSVLLLSMIVQFLAPLAFVTVDRALGFDTPLWSYLVAIPVVTLATFLPIHIAGIGILEGGLWLFLSRWSDRSPAEVIAICATIRLLGLVWLALLSVSFLGGVPQPTSGRAASIGRRNPRRRRHDCGSPSSMEKTEQPGHATSDEGAADTLDRSTSSIPWRSRSREDREPRQVLVVIVQGLGDLVLAIPALKAIRRRFPRARLTLAAKAGVLDVLAREPFVDEHLPLDLPRDRWLHLAARGWDLTRRIRRRRFDLLINLTTPLTLATYLKCRLFNALCRPRSAIGGTLNDCLCLLPRRRGIRYRHETHEVEMKFRLLHGLVSRPLLMMPSLTEAKEPNAFVKHIRSSARHRPVLAVCAGCLRQSKQWPPDKFVQTLRLLSAPLAPLVVLLGSQGERDISHAIASALGGNVMDLTGQVSTGQLAAVVAAADCLLTIDTGLMHVAAATGTPLVAILGAEIPQRYHPVVVRGRARVFYRPSPCSPCLLRHCPHQRCMAWIEPAQVAEAVVELTRLRSRPASPKPCAGRSNGASELESCATSERRP